MLKIVSSKPKNSVSDVSPMNLQQARDNSIESAGKISANMLGMVSKVGGQIYALLFLARNPMSLDEIMKILQLSKGNISVNIRMLESVGLVRKVWVKGTRKDYYEAARDYPKKFLRQFFDRVRNGIDDSLRMISKFKDEFETASQNSTGDEKEDAQFMLSQLMLLDLFYQASSQLFDDFYKGRKVDMDILRKVILE